MALSMVVTNDLTNSPPRRQIVIAGSSGTSISIGRIDQDGNIRPVRGGDPAQLVGGGVLVYDVEAPYGQVSTYTASPTDGSASVSQVIGALSVTQAWLIHEGQPSLSMPIHGWKELTPRDDDSGEALHVVSGREYPISITDGTRKGESYQAQVKTETDAELAAWEAIVGQSVPLLLQLVYPSTTETVWEYISIGKTSKARRSQAFGDPRRLITFDVTVVDRPAGGVAAQRTVADVAVEVATVAALKAKYVTGIGVLTGIAGT